MPSAKPPSALSRFADDTAPSFVCCVAIFTALVVGWTAQAAWHTHATSNLSRVESKIQKPAQALAARHRVHGTDRENRSATFDVFVFPKHLQWSAGRADTIAAPGRWLTQWQIPAQLFDADIRARIRNAKAIIALGSATEDDGAPSPNLLAGLRAQEAGRWLAAIVPPETPLRSITLGLYKSPCARCENPIVTWQRPLAFAAVVEADAKANLAAAFKNALRRTTNLPAPDHFTAFAWVNVPR